MLQQLRGGQPRVKNARVIQYLKHVARITDRARAVDRGFGPDAHAQRQNWFGRRGHWRRLPYPLTPVITTPSTKYRCARKKITRIGSSTATLAAINR